jgi:hypothetical protein
MFSILKLKRAKNSYGCFPTLENIPEYTKENRMNYNVIKQHFTKKKNQNIPKYTNIIPA